MIRSTLVPCLTADAFSQAGIPGGTTKKGKLKTDSDVNQCYQFLFLCICSIPAQACIHWTT